jgi:hypothetical protein
MVNLAQRAPPRAHLAIVYLGSVEAPMKYAIAALAVVASAYLLSSPAAAQSRRDVAIQRCIQQAQARVGNSFYRDRARVANYRACMHRYGFRP